MILWLTAVAGAAQDQARLMNLMFFLPCALCASIFRWKQAKPELRLTLCAVGAGLAGAWIGVWLNGILPLKMLKKALGVLFLVCGVRELRYRERKFR